MARFGPRRIKALVATVLMCAATALFIYGTVAPLFFVEPNGAYVTLWELCQITNDQVIKETCQKLTKYDCEEQHDTISSARAFTIVSIFVSFVGFYFALLETFRYRTTKWRVIFCLMTFVSGLVAWAILLSFYTTKQCELFGDSINHLSGARLGGAFIGTFVAWMLSVISISIELIDERWFYWCDKDDDPAYRRKHRSHHHNNNNRRGSSSGAANNNNNNNNNNADRKKSSSEREKRSKSGNKE
jgi:hypothetical protein